MGKGNWIFAFMYCHGCRLRKCLAFSIYCIKKRRRFVSISWFFALHLLTHANICVQLYCSWLIVFVVSRCIRHSIHNCSGSGRKTWIFPGNDHGSIFITRNSQSFWLCAGDERCWNRSNALHNGSGNLLLINHGHYFKILLLLIRRGSSMEWV